MREPSWQTECSVETSAPLEFAWNFMSNVANWNDPPAQFFLNGPFANGSPGTTEMPGQPLQHWWLREVLSMESYTIEFPLDRAVMFSSGPLSRLRMVARGLRSRSFLKARTPRAI
ncbi:MAG: hypothetical protein JOZ83_04815 [Silvibacterium sp.]|nr:hypothetical protein [Silvibacterium sp.]